MKFEVGAPFAGNFLPEKPGLVLDYTRDTGWVLALRLEGIDQHEIDLFCGSEEFRFALLPEPGFFFLLVEIPGLLDWSDAPWSIFLNRGETGRDPLDIPAVGSLKVTALLVEHRDLRIRAIRDLHFGADFTQAMLSAIGDQDEHPATAEQCLERIAVIQARESSTRMLRRARAHSMPGSGMA